MEEQEFVIFDNNIKRTKAINNSGEQGSVNDLKKIDRRSYSLQEK